MEFLPVSILIGIQFLISGWVKFRGLNTFIDILEKYPLPQIFKNQTFAWLIIIFEILLGVSFLSLQAEMIWFGCLGATFFIICASLLAFIRWLKGEKKIKCGCGQSLNQEKSIISLLLRNLIILFILLWGLFSKISAVSLFTKTALVNYLIGIGIFSIIKLFAANFRAIGYIKQWKVAG